jgi:uncharacterized protein (DUF433 family)
VLDKVWGLNRELVADKFGPSPKELLCRAAGYVTAAVTYELCIMQVRIGRIVSGFSRLVCVPRFCEMTPGSTAVTAVDIPRTVAKQISWCWAMANLNPRITVEPGKMGGKPCIRGLRFTVYDMASYLASGMSEDEILKDFPYLEKEDFQAVYEFFASIPERISVLEASR